MRGDGPALAVAPATPTDQPAIAAILEDARRWIAAKGIAQWTRPFGDEWLAAKIAGGEFWLVSRGGEPVAVVRLLWRDPLFWGERDDDDAAYVHTLALRGDCHGQGLGTWVLGWAERRARAEGRRALRLDCAADNQALRAYYQRAGFTVVGPARVGAATVILFEKRLVP